MCSYTILLNLKPISWHHTTRLCKAEVLLRRLEHLISSFHYAELVLHLHLFLLFEAFVSGSVAHLLCFKTCLLVADKAPLCVDYALVSG